MYDVAGRSVTVRFSDPRLVDMADQALVASDAPGTADPWFCVLAGNEGTAGRTKHSLFMGGVAVMRTSSSAHLTRALARNLAALTPTFEERSGLLHLRMLGLLNGAGMVLLDPPLTREFDRLVALVRRAGWSSLDLGIVSVDPATQEVALPDPAINLSLDETALKRLGDRHRSEPVVGGGRRPLLGLVTADEVPRSERAHQLLTRVGFPWAPRQRSEVDLADELAARLAVIEVDGSGPQAVADRLKEILTN